MPITIFMQLIDSFLFHYQIFIILFSVQLKNITRQIEHYQKLGQRTESKYTKFDYKRPKI